MSVVDLRKLVARKKFFIPAKSSAIHELILEGIDKKKWLTSSKRDRSGSYNWFLDYMWALDQIMSRGLSLNEYNTSKFVNEFNKDPVKHRDEFLGTRVRNKPFEVSYVVLDERDDGCICEVRCYPVLYGLLTLRFDVKYTETEMQDALLRSELFLVDLVVGGLRGEEFVERIDETKWELLVNDVNRHDIKVRIDQMLEQATVEVLLMGWIGTLLLVQLKELKNKGIDVKIITHKPGEARRQPWAQDVNRAYKELINIVGLDNISIRPESHGRTVIVDNKAIIGSMDLNAYSLGGSHVEFGVYTEDVDTVRKIRAYFRKIFTPLDSH